MKSEGHEVVPCSAACAIGAVLCGYPECVMPDVHTARGSCPGKGGSVVVIRQEMAWELGTESTWICVALSSVYQA